MSFLSFDYNITVIFFDYNITVEHKLCNLDKYQIVLKKQKLCNLKKKKKKKEKRKEKKRKKAYNWIIVGLHY